MIIWPKRGGVACEVLMTTLSHMGFLPPSGPHRGEICHGRSKFDSLLGKCCQTLIKTTTETARLGLAKQSSVHALRITASCLSAWPIPRQEYDGKEIWVSKPRTQARPR